MPLPPVGSAELLGVLAPFIPDDFINQAFARGRSRGRPGRFSPAQLWRAHLLFPLARVFSFNALARGLGEQAAWRRFARLPNRGSIPDVRMLHEFRSQLGAGGFRRVNDHLVGQVLQRAALQEKSVAFIDATDLPASAEDKKNRLASGRPGAPRWGRARDGPARRASLSATKSTRCACG